MDVGFIGLGVMGRAMAANLVKAGHNVRVWNRSKEPVDALVAQGAARAETPHEAFRGDAVLTMLADDTATRAVLLDSGAIDAAPKETIHVSMATISVALTEELAQRHAERGTAYVAAPVFGRPDVASEGKLNILAAGPADAIARVQPLLDAMGSRTWPFGDTPARAVVVKIVGNFMIASAIEAMAEGAALARAHGVPATELLGMLTSTLFASRVYTNYGSIIMEERFDEASFGLLLGLKDIGLALAAAEKVRAPLPFASVLRDNLLDAVAHGDGEKDWTALARVAARRAGLDKG